MEWINVKDMMPDDDGIVTYGFDTISLNIAEINNGIISRISTTNEILREAFERLESYENTGFTPEEIASSYAKEPIANYLCSKCYHELLAGVNYCSGCGQRIDWGDL